MSRFFKKSKNIDSLKTEAIQEFLHKEGLGNKVNAGRVEDFYNALSTLAQSNKIEKEGIVDYDQFNCKVQEDFDKIDSLREEEQGWLKGVQKDLLKGGNRLLKAASALAYKFEKEHYRHGTPVSDPNTYLRNLFTYEEEMTADKNVTFGEMLDVDVDFMKYLALLSKKKAFSKDIGRLEHDPAGKIVKYKPMESMQEVTNMDLIQCVMPDFNKKLATEDLYVKRRFVRKDRAQNLIIMIDDSGSMNSAEKRGMLKAALTLKLRDYNEVHHVYIGTFIDRNFGFHKVKEGDKFDDLDFIELNKGTTYIDRCVKDTIDCIRKRRLPAYRRGDAHILSDDHFEIMVINDGADSVDPTFHPAIKLHALCLMQNNVALKNICHRSGGTYHHLSGRD